MQAHPWLSQRARQLRTALRPHDARSGPAAHKRSEERSFPPRPRSSSTTVRPLKSMPDSASGRPEAAGATGCVLPQADRIIRPAGEEWLALGQEKSMHVQMLRRDAQERFWMALQGDSVHEAPAAWSQPGPNGSSSQVQDWSAGAHRQRAVHVDGVLTADQYHPRPQAHYSAEPARLQAAQPVPVGVARFQGRMLGHLAQLDDLERRMQRMLHVLEAKLHGRPVSS
jgi:hypothetical protein